tara:strand:- start:21292 stop:21999 length:708 start_codon:yes stop_codon:yes gene_type:complete
MKTPAIFLSVFLILVQGASLFAQDAEEEVKQFRVLALGNPTSLRGLFYDLNNEEVLIDPSDVSLSPLYEVPKGGELNLYRKIPPVPPETKPTKEVVYSADLSANQLSLVVLTSGRSKSVAGVVIDDSWEAFPSSQVRVLNMSKRRTAAQVEGVGEEIEPGGYGLFTYESMKPRIRIKVASYSDGQWKLRFNNSQAIVPGARINVLVTDFEPTPKDPNPDGVSVMKMIDPLLPPES